MTTVFRPVCFNFMMPNLRRRMDPSVPHVTTEAEVPTRGHIRPSRSLCRNLFGRVNHEENLKFVKKELDLLAEADSRRWNFDFVNEKPMEGKIQWKLADRTVPAAYNMPNLTTKITQSSASTSTQAAEEVAKVEETEKSIVPIEPADITATTTHIIVKPVVHKAVDASESNKKSASKSKSVKRKSSSQTHITDYLRSCKRPRPAESKVEEKSSRPVLKRAKMSS